MTARGKGHVMETSRAVSKTRTAVVSREVPAMEITLKRSMEVGGGSMLLGSVNGHN